MNISHLVHDAVRVQESFREVGEQLVTLTGCQIHVPVRYSECNLASIGLEVHTLACVAIVVNNEYYAVLNANAYVQLLPRDSFREKIENYDYHVFDFAPGDAVINTLQLVKNDTITYYLFDEFFSKGKYPWYMQYEELAQVFDTAKYHAGANVGQNSEVTELITALVCRNPDDPTQYYRTTIKNQSDVHLRAPQRIGLRSVIYAATNTTNRLGGSYFDTGVVGALVNPAERTERIEGLLRL